MRKKKNLIDISTDEKKNETFSLFNSFTKIGDIYSYYGYSDNFTNSKYVKKIAKEIGFDLNVYKERRYSKRYCLQCGKTLKAGQYKFCCKSCSATYNNTHRGPMTEETKEKIRQSLKSNKKKNINVSKLKKCPVCGTIIYNRNKYCSKECLIKIHEQKKMFICDYCGKEVLGLKKRRFCSITCTNNFLRDKLIDKFKKGEYKSNGNNKMPLTIRNFLLEQNNYKCELCGYEGYNIKTGNSILQIHHIDGNSKNNTPQNIQLICPNCHAKTDNYMALNKGKSGRDERYKNKEDKSSEC